MLTVEADNDDNDASLSVLTVVHSSRIMAVIYTLPPLCLKRYCPPKRIDIFLSWITDVPLYPVSFSNRLLPLL